MSFDVGAATYASATPRGRHRIATTFTKKHAYLFDLWDNPPAWFDVPDTDLQPAIAKALIEAAEAGEAKITSVVQRCVARFHELHAKSGALFAGSGAFGAFATFAEADRIEIGWIGYVRVYRVGDNVEQLSRDHSLESEYLRQVPEPTEEQLAEVRNLDVFTRAIGMRKPDPKDPPHMGDQPDVLGCTLAEGEWLVLVPRGIDARILGDARIARAKTADAAAKLIVALAVAEDPNGPTGAIVIRRTDEATKTPVCPVRELIARCPDRATESVIADWCEENGRREMVPWLRSDSGDVRANALHHLTVTLDAQNESRVTENLFRSALRLFRTLRASEWLRHAEPIVSVPSSAHEPLAVFCVEELRVPDRVKWAVAEELADHFFERTSNNPRVVPLARILTTPCPQCGRLALIVGQDMRRADGPGTPAWSTWLTALCMYEPHASRYERTSE